MKNNEGFFKLRKCVSTLSEITMKKEKDQGELGKKEKIQLILFKHRKSEISLPLILCSFILSICGFISNFPISRHKS